jgi:hypothetical protein
MVGGTHVYERVVPRHKKKRRIVSIVVSLNQSVFERLMLLDYQIRLDLASVMVSVDRREWMIFGFVKTNRST